MASSRKKRSRAVVTLLLCLAAVCIVAALVLYGLANRKLKALQQGADFEFTYAVTSQGGTTHPALYSILDQAGATEDRPLLPRPAAALSLLPRCRHHRDQRRQLFHRCLY